MSCRQLLKLYWMWGEDHSLSPFILCMIHSNLHFSYILVTFSSNCVVSTFKLICIYMQKFHVIAPPTASARGGIPASLYQTKSAASMSDE